MKFIERKSFKVFIAIFTAITCILYGGMGVNAKLTGNGVAVYVPSASSSFDPAGATYARLICLKNSDSDNGTLLCTYDQLKNVDVTVNGSTVSKQVYPIYKSTDDGETWTLIANVYDQEYDLPKTSQPCLYELPEQVGSLPAGTILLAGNIFDDDPATVSRIVIYYSTDGGYNWSFLSQVDSGGPCVYDPSTTSTTTTIWEPYLGLSSSGDLVCYYSDERQKDDGVLQAVSLRASSDGINWGEESNVAAIDNTSDRPGMITVTELPNGKYLATYEVVNRPSITNNNALVYAKFSDDGVTWDESSLGTKVTLSDGRGIGSSPFVKWVDAGGPNGMVIISSKWATDEDGDISGGQNFYVNYNLGEGSWERLPYAVTYDSSDTAGGYFSGFSQSFDVNEDNTVLYQATNVENLSNSTTVDGTTYYLNDIRVGTIPLNATIYEAENATLNDVTAGEAVDASGGEEAQYINYSDSTITFSNIKVPTAGTYTINVRYSNAWGSTATHTATINGSTTKTISYPGTVDWNRFLWSSFTCTLNAGINTIQLKYNTNYAEVDCIQVCMNTDTDVDGVVLVNKNSSKYLEVVSASTQSGAAVGQWGNTDNRCQKWIFEDADDGYYKIKNSNSGLYLDVEDNSTSNGAEVIQASSSSNSSQLWSLEETSDGYMHIVNKNSGLYLEILGNSTSDGASAGQWADTGYGCQEWSIIKEGIY